MSARSETYKHLVGKHVDEAVEAVKADGMEPRVYHNMGYIRSDNPKMVQLQVDHQTKIVKKVS